MPARVCLPLPSAAQVQRCRRLLFVVTWQPDSLDPCFAAAHGVLLRMVLPAACCCWAQEAYAEYKAEQAAQGRGPGASGLPLIVYSSRTHSQLAQVMKELRKCTGHK